jgi:LysM repeat protein
MSEDQARGSGDDDGMREAVDELADTDPEDAIDAADPPPGVTSRGGQVLTNLAEILRDAGLDVVELDGWQQRQRGGSGYEPNPIGIIVHHTASSSSWDGKRDAEYIGRDCDVAPMANLYIARNGTWWVLAAGASNTNGTGGPWGPIPVDSANSRVIGIEAGNNGIGEPWPDVMQTSYVKGVAALADKFDIDGANILAHHEWAPTRKVDPAGPSRFGSINASQSWDMKVFRDAVNKARGQAAPIKTPKGPHKKAKTYVVRPGDTWWAIAQRLLGDPAANWPKLAEANGGTKRVLRSGDVLKIPGAPPDDDDAPPTIPAFPGEAKRPDRGPVVLAWQQALISRHVIRDRPANRDSEYGDGMHNAVVGLQRSWGWSDADGVAGKHTWSKLHGGT